MDPSRFHAPTEEAGVHGSTPQHEGGVAPGENGTKPRGYKPRVLVTNDDGIHAPGLLQLVEALVRTDQMHVFVCAPEREASASSHGVCTAVKMRVAPTLVPGTRKAVKVWGRPADTVMLALTSPLFDEDETLVCGDHKETLSRSGFDLVVSGINRGDNCGLHVVYSGTVAGAREAACKESGPAIALSLDSHSRAASYEDAAKAALPLLLAAASSNKTIWKSTECVLNVNIPNCPLESMKGYMLTFQGRHCYKATWSAMEVDETDDETGEKVMYVVNTSGALREDSSMYSDSWAVQQGWVSLTPLALHSCYTRIVTATNKAVSVREQPALCVNNDVKAGTQWGMGSSNAAKALEGSLQVAVYARNLQVSS